LEKKIIVDAQIDIETIDEKIQKVLQMREEFMRAVYELEQAVRYNTFQLTIKGSPSQSIFADIESKIIGDITDAIKAATTYRTTSLKEHET